MPHQPHIVILLIMFSWISSCWVSGLGWLGSHMLYVQPTCVLSTYWEWVLLLILKCHVGLTLTISWTCCYEGIWCNFALVFFLSCFLTLPKKWFSSLSLSLCIYIYIYMEKIKWDEWLIMRVREGNLDYWILHEWSRLKYKVMWLF